MKVISENRIKEALRNGNIKGENITLVDVFNINEGREKWYIHIKIDEENKFLFSYDGISTACFDTKKEANNKLHELRL